MKYREYTFTITPMLDDAADILSALLGDSGFETFQPNDGRLDAYVQEGNEDLPAISDAVQQVQQMLGVEITYTAKAAPHYNFNATWEQDGFQPILIDTRLVVHSTHHCDIPPCTYDITICPTMAFGTGTHPTTRMLLTWLLDHDITHRHVIDAGCGTGILGILAIMRGADSLLAYDIDQWSTDSTTANLALNHIQAQVLLGDSTVIQNRQCDLLIANINRNILIADLPRFAAALSNGGTLLLSGFYRSDQTAIVARASEFGLVCLTATYASADTQESEQWCLLQFTSHISS